MTKYRWDITYGVPSKTNWLEHVPRDPGFGAYGQWVGQKVEGSVRCTMRVQIVWNLRTAQHYTAVPPGGGEGKYTLCGWRCDPAQPAASFFDRSVTTLMALRCNRRLRPSHRDVSIAVMGHSASSTMAFRETVRYRSHDSWRYRNVYIYYYYYYYY